MTNLNELISWLAILANKHEGILMIGLYIVMIFTGWNLAKAAEKKDSKKYHY